MIDVEPTAEKIEEMASTIEYFASSIRRQATRMRETNDLSVSADVATEVACMFTNIRLDLLITRPLREMQSEIERMSQ